MKKQYQQTEQQKRIVLPTIFPNGCSVAEILKLIFLIAFSFAFCWRFFGNWVSVAALFCFAVIAFVCFKVNLPKFPLLLFLFSFCLRLLLVCLIDTPVESDFVVILQASEQFKNGDFSFQHTSYFTTWAGQTGQVIFQGLLLKIWDNVFFLKAVNCLAAAGSNLLVYLIAKDYFSEKAAKTVSVLYCLSIFPAVMTTVLTNQHVSAFLTYLALYLLMAKKFGGMKFYIKYPLAALLIAFSNMIRPDALVVVAAVCVFCVFGIFQKLSVANLKKYGLRLLAFTAAYLLAGSLLSGVVQLSGVNQNGLSTQGTKLKFILGLNPYTSGCYSTAVFHDIQRYVDQGMSRGEAESAVLRDELRAMTPDSFFRLLDNKISVLWTGNATDWSFKHLREEYKISYAYARSYEVFCSRISLIFALAGFLYSYLRGRKELKRFLLPFLIFATFFVYLLIEVQPRYAYSVQIALFIMAAGGIDAVHKGICLLRKQSEPVSAANFSSTPLAKQEKTEYNKHR